MYLRTKLEPSSHQVADIQFTLVSRWQIATEAEGTN
jgi:hypothetical protein